MSKMGFEIIFHIKCLTSAVKFYSGNPQLQSHNDHSTVVCSLTNKIGITFNFVFGSILYSRASKNEYLFSGISHTNCTDAPMSFS